MLYILRGSNKPIIIDVRVFSLGIWKMAEGTYIRKRSHVYDKTGPYPANSWKVGDIAQNLEWLDTDWIEDPIEIVEILSDGRLKITPVRKQTNGQWEKSGHIHTVPFLANHKFIDRKD